MALQSQMGLLLIIIWLINKQRFPSPVCLHGSLYLSRMLWTFVSNGCKTSGQQKKFGHECLRDVLRAHYLHLVSLLIRGVKVLLHKLYIIISKKYTFYSIFGILEKACCGSLMRLVLVLWKKNSACIYFPNYGSLIMAAF